ncbi:hypothetical protein [uncultured Ruegeria sp.]|uniref:hypothetical protein n=1 Tax=uncultured Ruegeria sp. TaxID=259304 RepID=UPI0026338DEF|nr:hypothetical protein [uncultured Ruegeria sp.]
MGSIIGTCLFLAGHANARMAEVSCDDSDRMANRLTIILNAERQGTGLRDPETVLEVWVMRKSRDWVIVQNYANGTSCIVAMGEHWQSHLPDPA